MRSKFYSRAFRNYIAPIPREITVTNDPELSAVLPIMSNAEYKHFVTYSLLSHLPVGTLDTAVPERYEEFRDSMIKKYSKP